MPQSKKTLPSKMSVKAMVEEHRSYSDDEKCEHKARRLAIKDRLHTMANADPLGEAAIYANERGWRLQVPV